MMHDMRLAFHPARQPRGAAGDQQQDQGIAAGPQPALALEREIGLDDQRIGDQAAEAADVGGGIERIGIAAMAGDAVPALEKRRLGRDGEEQRTDRGDEQPRHPQRRLGFGGQFHG
ncbi:hypothetical protein PY38_00115, partial [Staphylococcus aureus]